MNFGERMPEAELLDTELFLGVGTEALGAPGRSPDYIDGGVANSG